VRLCRDQEQTSARIVVLSLVLWMVTPVMESCDGGPCEPGGCRESPRISFLDSKNDIVSLGFGYTAELTLVDPSGVTTEARIEATGGPTYHDLETGRTIITDPRYVVPLRAPGEDGAPTFIAVRIESEDWIGHGEFQPEYGYPCCPDLALERLTLTLEPKNPSGGAAP